jgi:hypothetical protein
VRQAKKKILYIDDEQNNLNAFKATFRFDFTILTALGANQAYEQLAMHPDVSVILCDQRMPEKTGTEFFAEIREKYPAPVRMLITGYADIQAVIDAVNDGHIFRYIKKPWTDTDIQSAIEEAYTYYITSSQLAARNKELQVAYDELGKFTYSITHHIRGPLLSVLGALDIAKSMDNFKELREILDMMESAVRKLDEFIKNTHEYYALKSSSLVMEQIDFNKVLKDVSELFRIGGKLDNIRFSYSVAQHATFLSDEIAIKIILNNLLSNAFKYQRREAEDKFVDIQVTVADNTAVITVKDNGIGIPADQIEHIFTMFYRATSQESGSGFGLYNVKDALSKLKGTIEVTSKVDEGTIFKVVLPGKEDDAK